MTRRQFVLNTACLAYGASQKLRAAAPLSSPLNSESLKKFVDPLPIPEAAKPLGMRSVPGKPAVKVPYYKVAMREIRQKLHRDLPEARLWAYGSSSPGPTFEARSGEGILVEWSNELPAKHFLPIDHTLHGAEKDKPEARGVVHVHGARVPPDSDGYPEDWCVPGQSQTCFYPNEQDAAALWYHDHAMGITRLNTYAGLFGFYIIRDRIEESLALPRGEYEIPLAICDRFLLRDGQIDYPAAEVPGKPWLAEVFGDVPLVNGKAYPHLEVEPRAYRFRVLNAANGRFLHLSLSSEQRFHQIGTDQGLLPAPVQVERTMVAPGERADLVIDFSSQAGKEIVLQSDYFQIMQFRVKNVERVAAAPLPALLRSVPKTPESTAVKTRPLHLGEEKTMKGESMRMYLNNTPWHMPVTENPALDSTEIWSFINTTDDSHPIHLHMVRFQILDRRSFEPFIYLSTGEVRYTDKALSPAPWEAGWKDTVRADPGMVTRIIVKFEGYAGRYVWHCHILEHEDNEMMRPYDVLPASGKLAESKGENTGHLIEPH
ncbi:MAG TPA: multicopper oxidase domain-containing protein [Bryobacteraceae bacterium]|jgi:spore coat protein A|nr:multicopper oxidase domain-containing protein [Bryobacteraceae bacterium]